MPSQEEENQVTLQEEETITEGYSCPLTSKIIGVELIITDPQDPWNNRYRWRRNSVKYYVETRANRHINRTALCSDSIKLLYKHDLLWPNWFTRTRQYLDGAVANANTVGRYAWKFMDDRVWIPNYDLFVDYNDMDWVALMKPKVEEMNERYSRGEDLSEG